MSVPPSEPSATVEEMTEPMARSTRLTSPFLMLTERVTLARRSLLSILPLPGSALAVPAKAIVAAIAAAARTGRRRRKMEVVCMVYPFGRSRR